MIEFKIPGCGDIEIEHLVLDYNGTLATDGVLEAKVHLALLEISKQLKIHIITADTNGNVMEQAQGFPSKINIITSENQEKQKLDYIEALDKNKVIAIGNGRNDQLMLKNAKIGIGVINHEGVAIKTMMEADILCLNIIDALHLILFPNRMKASLRN